jgi:hypothetical protein
VPVHSLGDLLKCFVREMPDSLLDCRFWDEWLQVAKIEKHLSRARACKEVLLKLDSYRQALVTVLFTFLREVSRKAKVNKMTPTNLGTVWAPTILMPLVYSPSVAMDAVQPVLLLVETMIQHYDVVFNDFSVWIIISNHVCCYHSLATFVILQTKYTLMRTINTQSAVAARGTYGKTKTSTLRATPARPVPPPAAPAVAVVEVPRETQPPVVALVPELKVRECFLSPPTRSF